MTAGRELIEGYESPIHRALWERILTWGAPRLWSALWVVVCLYAALVLLTAFSARWALVPLGLWPVGQGIMVWLTMWDVQFDDVLLASVKYRSFYDAG
jgi:type IV secretory pathway TrbD component